MEGTKRKERGEGDETPQLKFLATPLGEGRRRKMANIKLMDMKMQDMFQVAE